ncbi:helix-turn-helix domain-containing protein [Leptolyngbya sp. AN02str]|uniref:helix-turn-helix domain-containing protein n=1 Tax=Leptolyngbya sp. AN02str TaxID=3423363 RepID=UPI003D31560E
MSKDQFLNASLSELQVATGVDRATWSKWLNGHLSPRLDTLEAIAVKLGVEVWVLVHWFKLRQGQM